MSTPEPVMSKTELAFRTKLKSDFEFYAPKALKIRPKAGALVPFTLNKAQRYLHLVAEKQILEKGRVRIIVLKGRQQGCCLSPDTRVTLSDLTTTTINNINVGDKLLSVDEEGVGITAQNRKSTRKMRTAVVEAKVELESELFEISLSNGTTIKSTDNHRWLTRQRGGSYVWWRKLKDLKVGDVLRAASFDDGNIDSGFDDGWIGGALDADGSCSTTGVPRVSFSQVNNAVLAKFKDYLVAHGVKFYENIDNRTKVGEGSKLGDKPVHQVRVDSFPHIVRLVSKSRPVKFDIESIYMGRKLPCTSDTFNAWPEIISIRSLGVSRVVDIQTSEKTFIANGIVSHNSTYVEGRFYWRVTHRKGVGAFILTHEDKATETLFDMAQRYHDNCLEQVKPVTGAQSAKALNFSALDSGYKVGTAGSKAVGRGSANQYFHGSEVAHWPHADTHAMGVMQGIPLMDGTEIFLESTANGPGNFFHAQWQLAEREESDYIAVFIPWYWQDEYTLPCDDEFELTTEEFELLKLFKKDGLTAEHLNWRRMKTGELSTSGEDGDWRFKQEYPFTSAEAFQTSGEESLIDPKFVLAARKTEKPMSGAHVVGVDPARYGKDRTAIIHRNGRKAYGSVAYRKKSVMEVAGICVRILTDAVTGNPTDVDMMFIDVGGLGAGVYDRLEELGYAEDGRIMAVNSANRALQDDRYTNKRAEMGVNMRDWFEMPGGVDIEDLDVLQADICGPRYSYDSSGRYVIESKKDMKKRGMESPDFFDSLGLTLAEPVAPPNLKKRRAQANIQTVDYQV